MEQSCAGLIKFNEKQKMFLLKRREFKNTSSFYVDGLST